MRLEWKKYGCRWILEDCRQHTAGEVEQRAEGYIAGVVIPYQIIDGEERDWMQSENPFHYLHEAIGWVEENAKYLIGGEPIGAPYIVADIS